MTRRSMMFVAAGVLTVLLGVAVLLLNRGGPSEAAAAQPVAEEDGVKVLVAKEKLAVDTDANEAFRAGQIEVKTVAIDDRAADALTSAADLDGRTVVVEVEAGSQLGTGSLSRPPLRTQAIKVPAGTQGLAIEVPFAAGGAGYIAPGDKVDVMAMMDADNTAAGDPEAEPINRSTVAVLRNVVVLDVSTELAPRVATGRVTTTTSSTTPGAAAPPAPNQLTYLLAIPEPEVERVVQAAGYHRLYLALTSGEGETTRPEPSSVDDGDLRGEAP